MLGQVPSWLEGGSVSLAMRDVAVVARLAARLAVWGPLGGSGSSHADKEYIFLGPARARQP